MKNFKAIRFIYFSLILVGAALLNGCGKQTLDFRNADIVNGKVYVKEANKPFSGSLTNVPSQLAMPATPATSIFLKTAVSVADDGLYATTLATARWACDVSVNEGYLDGEITCKILTTENLIFRTSMKNGILNGDFKLYDLTPQNNVFSETTFNDGVLDGVQKTYSLQTRKLIHSFTWKNNHGSGSLEMFDKTTGNLIYHAPLENGRINGEMIRYAPDGKTVTFKGTFSNGVVVGTDEAFYPETGKIMTREETSNGKRHGAFKQWDADGQLTVDQVYENGILVKDLKQTNAQPSSASNTGGCVDNWMTAFKKESGDDSMISMEQMGEWDKWCKEGKTPAKL